MSSAPPGTRVIQRVVPLAHLHERRDARRNVRNPNRQSSGKRNVQCPECPVSDWTVTHVILSDLCPVLSDQCPIYVRLMSDCVSDHVRKPCPVSVRNVRQCPINCPECPTTAQASSFSRQRRVEARRGASRRIEAHRGVEASSFTQQHIITPSNGIEASSFVVEASRLASSLDVEASRPGLSL